MKRFRRIMSFTLALAMLLSTMVFTTSSLDTTKYTPQDGVIIFNSQSVVDKFITSSNNVKYSYDKTEKALKVEVTGGDPGIYINWKGAVSTDISCKSMDYVYTVYKSPTTNSSSANLTGLFFCTTKAYPNPNANALKQYSVKISDQYVISRTDVTGMTSDDYKYMYGNFLGFRYDIFENAKVGDVMYIDSVIINNPNIPGAEIAGARTAIHNGYPVDANSIYLCREYDAKKYTSPFWKGNVVYNEAVCPIANDDGSYTYTLMYTPDEIIYVYDGTFSRFYEEGKDFTVKGNKLTILNGSIKKYALNQAYSGDALYFEDYLNVTYTHSDKWDYYIPTSQASELPKTSSAIKNNEKLNLVFFGDSITGGSNASSYRGYYPNAPYWWMQIEDALRENYGFSNLNVYDVSQGGASSSQMIGTFNDSVLTKNPDLIFIEFGVNDAQHASNAGKAVSTLKSEFKSAIKSMITAARSKNSNCEIVLVAPYYSHIYNYKDEYFEACRDACIELANAYDKVVCLNMTDLHGSLYDVKRHYDITGDNACHPNDYMSRIFAQAGLATIIPEDVGYNAYPPSESETPLEITSISPSSATINKTGSATFVASVSGEGVSYKWNTSSLPAGVSISGASTNTLKLSVNKAMNGSFTKEISLTVTDSNGKTATKSVKLSYTGITPPTINTITPDSATINETGSVSFKANATGDSLTYKWDTSSLPEYFTVSGNTSSTLSVSVASPKVGDFTYDITLTVTDSIGNTTQKIVQLSYDGLLRGNLNESNDGNESITLKDVFEMKLIVKKFVDPTDRDKAAGDVDGDGDVDIIDLFYLKVRIMKGEWTI